MIAGQMLYFIESNTRSATIIGVVGAGGIGLYLSEQIRVLEWRQVSFLILLILVSGRGDRLHFRPAARGDRRPSVGPAPDGARKTVVESAAGRATCSSRITPLDELTIAARRRAMGLARARARLSELAEPLTRRLADHGARDLKPVETGLVMLRGRAGGDGAPFNLGEATVTRAIVELPSGERGYAHILGRDAERARLAAIFDALWQEPDRRARRSRPRARADRRRGSPPSAPGRAPRPPRPGSTSSPSCAARTRHERARLRRSGVRIPGGVSSDPAGDGFAGTIVACGRGARAAGAASPRRRGGDLLTLADFETPLWIAPSLAAWGEAADYLAFHTGAPLAASPDKAAFALVDLERDASISRASRKGAPEYPDRSTTVVAQARSLARGPAMRICGPGVRGDGGTRLRADAGRLSRAMGGATARPFRSASI